jgi:aminopeptidase N
VQTASAGDITIYSYSFPYDKSAAEEVLQNTADALQLFSQLIMPYPHSTLSVVEADFLDGMEYDGLYFLSHGFYNLYDGTPKGYLTFIAAHETAHQWWYGLVGNDQALEPWLDEAMCTYMEHIFYENIYADYPPGSGQSLVDWWWYYRINFYEPTGWVDGTIYDFNQFRPYRDAVYLNGAKFLDDLRILIGDEAFYAFLRDYAEQEKLNVATATDFFAILRAHTNQDLDELLAQYFQVAR